MKKKSKVNDTKWCFKGNRMKRKRRWIIINIINK